MAINASMPNGRQFSFSLQEGHLKKVCDNLIELQNSLMPSKAAASQMKDEIDIYSDLLSGTPQATTAQVYIIKNLTATEAYAQTPWVYNPLLHFSVNELTRTANAFSTPNRFYYEALSSIPVSAAPKLRPAVNLGLMTHTPIHPVRSDRLATYADICTTARKNCDKETGLTLLGNAGDRALSEFRVLGHNVGEYASMAKAYVAVEPFIWPLNQEIYNQFVTNARRLPRWMKFEVYQNTAATTHVGCPLHRRAVQITKARKDQRPAPTC